MYKVSLSCTWTLTFSVCPCPPPPLQTSFKWKGREKISEYVAVFAMTFFFSVTSPTLRWLWKLCVLVLKRRHVGMGWDCHSSRNQIRETPRKKRPRGRAGYCGECLEHSFWLLQAGIKSWAVNIYKQLYYRLFRSLSKKRVINRIM